MTISRVAEATIVRVMHFSSGYKDFFISLSVRVQWWMVSCRHPREMPENAKDALRKRCFLPFTIHHSPFTAFNAPTSPCRPVFP
jgi:hypothetical protein